MSNPEQKQPTLGWSLEMLWQASAVDVPPIFTPAQQFNSEPLRDLAFPRNGNMTQSDYVQRMGFVGGATVQRWGERHRRVQFAGFNQVSKQGAPDVWIPPSAIFDLHHDGWNVSSCAVSMTEEQNDLLGGPPQERSVAGVSSQLLLLEAEGTPISTLPQANELQQMQRLVLSAGAVLLNAAAAA